MSTVMVVMKEGEKIPVHGVNRWSTGGGELNIFNRVSSKEERTETFFWGLWSTKEMVNENKDIFVARFAAGEWSYVFVIPEKTNDN